MKKTIKEISTIAWDELPSGNMVLYNYDKVTDSYEYDFWVDNVFNPNIDILAKVNLSYEYWYQSLQDTLFDYLISNNINKELIINVISPDLDIQDLKELAVVYDFKDDYISQIEDDIYRNMEDRQELARWATEDNF